MPNYSLNAPYLLISGLLVIGVVLVFVQYQPIIQEINGLRNDIHSLQSELVDKQAFLQTIDRKRSELAAYQEHEHRLQVMLPILPQIEDVVRTLHIAAANAGSHLLHFGIQGDTAQQEINAQRSRGEIVNVPDNINTLAATIGLNGSYGQIRSFLTQLNSSARLIDVSRLTINSRDDQSDVLNVEARLQFYQFSQP